MHKIFDFVIGIAYAFSIEKRAEANNKPGV